MVPYNILLPVDCSSKEFRLEEYAKTLAHLKVKHFSAFFINDYLRIKGADSKFDRSDIHRKVESQAKKLKLDLKFIPCPGSLPSLWYQSRFADLMVLDLLSSDNDGTLKTLNSEKFFEDFGCPIWLFGSLPEDQDDIVFVFDHDPASLAALKSFLGLFGKNSKNKKLTVINITSNEGPGIYFEKSLILHLQQVFENVGILPMNKIDIERNVISFAEKATRPLMIMGHAARALFQEESMADALIKNEISIYYCNH